MLYDYFLSIFGNVLKNISWSHLLEGFNSFAHPTWVFLKNPFPTPKKIG